MKLIYVIIIKIVITHSISAQVFVEKNLEDGINYIVDFINSKEFANLKEFNTDLELIDSIYIRVKKFHNNNISESLLTLTFATLPFDKMPLEIPFTGIVLEAKLPSGDSDYLKSKIANLPKKLFEDSPNSNFGDKDKTAHFFGNAYFAHTVTFFNLSKFLSIFVELFEDAFKVEGSIDNRDFIANHLGYLFGTELLETPDYLPSMALKKYPTFKNYFEEKE